jgi:hypothetical protein
LHSGGVLLSPQLSPSHFLLSSPPSYQNTFTQQIKHSILLSSVTNNSRGLADKFRDYTDKLSHGPNHNHHDHHGHHDPHQHPYLHPTEHQCQDPYLEAGYLTTNASEQSENFWTPFNSECPRAPHFLQDVIDRKPLPWLQGRTLLMVGDSVDRNNLRFFCELAGSDNMRVASMTNLSEVSLGDTDLEPWNIDPGDLTRPRICRVDEYDFEIIMFFSLWDAG